MAKAKPQKWTYQGRWDSIDIKLASGRWITVAAGETVELLPNEAKVIRTLPGWVKE